MIRIWNLLAHSRATPFVWTVLALAAWVAELHVAAGIWLATGLVVALCRARRGGAKC